MRPQGMQNANSESAPHSPDSITGKLQHAQNAVAELNGVVHTLEAKLQRVLRPEDPNHGQTGSQTLKAAEVMSPHRETVSEIVTGIASLDAKVRDLISRIDD